MWQSWLWTSSIPMLRIYHPLVDRFRPYLATCGLILVQYAVFCETAVHGAALTTVLSCRTRRLCVACNAGDSSQSVVADM
ncbi:hypothetical protein BS50DRAFT_572420 [Corynespora cassiicola Philippines]|uniref:Uncharacterized protein n=1 Tax=Corynespora cassiicola Philippines TaxID=1448308 RepID=A0A2T2NV63_CORCC|nr:hypothetical protein BS50DRAFT_572420 [Corynespora cassiicola Philippines]